LTATTIYILGSAPPAPSIVALTSAANVTVNWAMGKTQRVTAGHDIAFTFTGANDGDKCLLIVKQDAAVVRNPTLPATVRFTAIPSWTLTTNLGETEYLGFVYDSAAGKYDLVAVTKGGMGGVTYATSAEILAGTITNKAIAPDQLKAALILPKPNRNLIINGSLDIWQRGPTFAAIASAAYHADRFRYDKATTGAEHTITRDTDVPTSAQFGGLLNYSMKVDCTTADASVAAGDGVFIRQMIEGYNFKGLVGKTATLSFWVKATKTGIYCVSFANSINDKSYVVEYTVNAADTWEKKTIPITFDYSGGTWNYTNGVGLQIFWTLMCGSTFQTTAGAWQAGNYWATANQVNACDSTDNNFFLAGIQLEEGATATDFEFRTYQEELSLCQRYFECLGNFVGMATSATNLEGTSKFTVVKRGVPVIALVNGTSVLLEIGVAVRSVTSFPGYGAALDGTYISLTGATDMTAGKVVISYNVSGWISADAEL
jgi:hypothetical protein